jgi:hypothetical protein
MESINVIIDNEEVGSPSKGEETQPILEELPTPPADMVKPFCSIQETPGIPSAANSLQNPPKNCDLWEYF